MNSTKKSVRRQTTIRLDEELNKEWQAKHLREGTDRAGQLEGWIRGYLNVKSDVAPITKRESTFLDRALEIFRSLNPEQQKSLRDTIEQWAK